LSETTSQNMDAARAGLEAWQRGDLEALGAVLHADVELLGAEPGPWDCHGREAVMRLLADRQARGTTGGQVSVEALGEACILVSTAGRRPRAAAATLVFLRDGLVRRMVQFRSREAALAASVSAAGEDCARRPPT
jgi:ketosteroid isomerase-like protein